MAACLTGDALWTAIGRAMGMSRQQVRERHGEVIRRLSHRSDRDASGQRQPMTEAQASAAVDWIDSLVHELAVLLR